MWFSPLKGGGDSHAEHQSRRGQPSARALSEFSRDVATGNIDLARAKEAYVRCGNRDEAAVSSRAMSKG
jgi:hypothetical protein